jgi:putative flippase GtrA
MDPNIPSSEPPMNHSAGLTRPLICEIASFGAIGVVSTLAYLALYTLIRSVAAAPAANALALVVTAIGNTAANRRWTFDIRGSEGIATYHAAGLLVFLLALAISSAGLLLLHVLAPFAGLPLELAVLLSASVLATTTRFVVLRTWFASRRPAPASGSDDRATR